MIRNLTVLYDPGCGLCVKCKQWLSRQRKHVAIDFVAAGSVKAQQLFPKIAGADEELTVISNEGTVYRGAKAWILCLWALVDYRDWAIRLSRPALMPLARQAFQFLSVHRRMVSQALRLKSEADLATLFRSRPNFRCKDQTRPADRAQI